MAQAKCLADGDMAACPYNEIVDDSTLRRNREKSRKVFKDTMDELNTWIIDEKSITVPHRLYCWTVLAGCALVLGGLAIGLTVHTRIQGVDPSNITMFCWAVAGFVTVLAKSIRVVNWPWSDFLRGQVVCRSIKYVQYETLIPRHYSQFCFTWKI